MKWFTGNIEALTLENKHFRRVLYTAQHLQLVVMNIQPDDDIGTETHDENDQFIRIEYGQGKAIIDGREHDLKDGVAIVIPAWAQHNIINTSKVQELKLYTIYSPPHHKDGTIHQTKHDAQMNDEEFDGKTSE